MNHLAAIHPPKGWLQTPLQGTVSAREYLYPSHTISAIGTIPFGVVSVGAVAFGVLALAVLGVAIVSLASLAIGIIPMGAVATGYEIAMGAIVQSAGSAVRAVVFDSRFEASPLIRSTC